MNFAKTYNSQLLYDASDDHFYGVHKYLIQSAYEIEFNVSELKNLIELEKTWKPEAFQELLKLLGKSAKRFDLIPEFVQYKSEDGLPLCFKETKDYIAIISMGEFQPTRYIIRLEKLLVKN